MTHILHATFFSKVCEASVSLATCQGSFRILLFMEKVYLLQHVTGIANMKWRYYKILDQAATLTQQRFALSPVPSFYLPYTDQK